MLIYLDKHFTKMRKTNKKIYGGVKINVKSICIEDLL